VTVAPAVDPPSPRPGAWRGVAAALAFLGGAALGAGGGYIAKAEVRDETRFLNFDVESMREGALGPGWSSFEGTRSGDTFAWCTTRSCSVRVNVASVDDRIIRLRVRPFRFPGAPPQRATVSINDNPASTLTLPDGDAVLTVGADRRFWHKGRNELRFDLDYAEVPKERVPGTDDDRRLSIAVDWIEIIRR
jgi:hypothetical protein